VFDILQLQFYSLCGF